VTRATGTAWCRAHSDETDEWLRSLFVAAVDEVGGAGVALVAVGGYGRGELFPCSDLDVVLLHDRRDDIGAVADRIWYPIWDAGAPLSHSVRTVDQALDLARHDLDTATAALSARHLAGDETLTADLARRAAVQWERGAKRWLATLGAGVDERHRRNGEVAFLLEPDLKDGRGGLRDVHALQWATAARPLLYDRDDGALASAYERLAAARVELHLRTRQSSNRLTLQEQDAVATALDYDDADALMRAVSAAARTIAWISDDTWRRVRSSLRGPTGRIARRDRTLAPGVVVRDGELDVDPTTVRDDATAPLRMAALAATHDVPIGRRALSSLTAAPPLPDPWPAPAREALVALLRAGHRAVPVIEALDQIGVWCAVLPEWAHVRSTPQRNAYHRFTVDRHLVEAAVNSGERSDAVDRPDVLVIGALLHDIGKGLPGDHTEVGMAIARTSATRMGFGEDEVAAIVAMVEHHLLLPDVATRRDLDDPGTIARVAELVGDTGRLDLLAVLTEADSLATGPQAWGSWKAGLVQELVARVRHALAGGAVSTATLAPAQQALLDRQAVQVEGDGDRLTVVARDEPGLFARISGALTLQGVAVRAATAHSDDNGWVLDEFDVAPEFDDVIEWRRVEHAVRDAMRDGADLDEALARKVRAYPKTDASASARATVDVRFDNDISSVATVVEVHAPDAVGLLHRIAKAFAALTLDIRSARVQTMGPRAVDAFYVCDRRGHKIVDDATLDEIRRTVTAALHG